MFLEIFIQNDFDLRTCGSCSHTADIIPHLSHLRLIILIIWIYFDIYSKIVAKERSFEK